MNPETIMMDFGGKIARIVREPPLRLLTRALLKRLSVKPSTRSEWDLSSRPAYLLGLVTAAEQAKSEGRKTIAAIEFGVAGGAGLVILQAEAAAVERETGIEIRVYGFDCGPGGLPDLIGDHRDHPERWRAGDFPMDVEQLQARLEARTTLILGNVRESVSEFFAARRPPPVGFVSFDLDLYSSTRDALAIFGDPARSMLLHCPLYFDDLGSYTYHHRAGELLAIREFNERNGEVTIDVWHGARDGRPFPEQAYLGHLYVAHDLRAADAAVLNRGVDRLPLVS